MYFKGISLTLLFSVSSQLMAEQASTETSLISSVQSQLSLQPNQCVALRKARDCFATIEMRWSTAEQGNYCLISNQPKRALACWSNANEGQFAYQFASQTSVEFILIEQHSQKVLSSAKVEVSWLYNSANKRRRWRLF